MKSAKIQKYKSIIRSSKWQGNVTPRFMVIHLSYILINILCILYTDAQIVIKVSPKQPHHTIRWIQQIVIFSGRWYWKNTTVRYRNDILWVYVLGTWNRSLSLILSFSDLTLENICPSEMYISVRGVKCCEINSLTGAKDCESMKLLGGDPGILCAGKTRNVTLIYPNLVKQSITFVAMP